MPYGIGQTNNNNKQQRPSESRHQYETEIVRLVRLAYRTIPKVLLEYLMVETFIHEIRDIVLQQEFEEALLCALKFETDKST